MTERKWVQFELKPMPGAELWVIVRAMGNTFKLPASCAIQELLQGIADGWGTDRKPATAPTMVRISWSRYKELEAAAGLVEDAQAALRTYPAAFDH